jgi:hypothetical protein
MLMATRSVYLGLAGLALGLGACSSNPLGDPVWSGWDNGQKAVSAYDAQGAASTPTGAIPPQQSGYSAGYGDYRSDGRTTQGGVQSAPLAPPPGASISPPGSGPRAPGYGSQSSYSPPSSSYGQPSYSQAASPPPNLAQATLTPEEAQRASTATVNPVPPANAASPVTPAVTPVAASGAPAALHGQVATADTPAPANFHPTGQKPVVQRTLPLVVAGQAVDRGTAGR